MNAKILPLIGLGLLVVVAIPVKLVLFPSAPAKSDNVPLVDADTQLGDPLPVDEPKKAIKSTVKAEPKAPAGTKNVSHSASWEEVIRNCEPSVAVVKGKIGHGTGFLLPNGVLATNAHVISLEFEENLRVHFPSAEKKFQGPYKAQFIWADRRRDLAFLYVECKVPCIELAEEYDFRKGQEVLAIGNPGIGKNELLPNAVSRGLMSTKTKLDKQPFFQLDIAVNPGNSGGPVLDSSGHVLGMVTAKMRDKEGIAFAIPLDDLNQGVQEVAGQGRESTPELIAWHRGCTVLERLVHIGDLYLAALDANSRHMDAAVARGQSPNDGLRLVPEQIHKDVQVIDKMFADNLEKNLQLTLQAEHLFPEDKARLARLWDVVRAMRKAYDEPSGTVASYRAKNEQLGKEFERLLTREQPKKPASKKKA